MSKIKLNIGTRLFRKLTVISCYVYIFLGLECVNDAKSFMVEYHEGTLPKWFADYFVWNLFGTYLGLLSILISTLSFVFCHCF